MELNQELFLTSHFVSLSQTLMKIKEQQNFFDLDTVNMLVERIGQVIQVAVVTGSLKINGKKIRIHTCSFVVILYKWLFFARGKFRENTS